MKKFVFAVSFVFAVLFASMASAQTGTPSSKLGFDQSAPTLAEAQSYTYKYYADGSTTGVALSGVTCTGTASPFACQVNFPAFTPGSHTIQLSATNVAGEGAKSTPLAFVFVVVPAAPGNLRIQ